MTAQIIDIKTHGCIVSDGITFDLSVLFESAKELEVKQAVLIGYNKDGCLEVLATHGIAESFLLASQGVQHLLNATGRGGDEPERTA